jgi:hypothetical protein
MTTGSAQPRGLGVAQRGGWPRPLVGGVGWGGTGRAGGADDLGSRGVAAWLSRYLPSPYPLPRPPTGFSLGNVSWPEHCPASFPIPKETRPIKVVFPSFSGWGRGGELGNWSGLELDLNPPSEGADLGGAVVP